MLYLEHFAFKWYLWFVATTKSIEMLCYSMTISAILICRLHKSKMEVIVGFEPTTGTLQKCCSAIELYDLVVLLNK